MLIANSSPAREEVFSPPSLGIQGINIARQLSEVDQDYVREAFAENPLLQLNPGFGVTQLPYGEVRNQAVLNDVSTEQAIDAISDQVPSLGNRMPITLTDIDFRQVGRKSSGRAIVTILMVEKGRLDDKARAVLDERSLILGAIESLVQPINRDKFDWYHRRLQFRLGSVPYETTYNQRDEIRKSFQLMLRSSGVMLEPGELRTGDVQRVNSPE